MHTLFGGLPVRRGSGDWICRDRDYDAWVAGEDRLDVRNLRLWLEVGIGFGDDLNPHLPKLLAQTSDLRRGPVVTAVVHDDGRGCTHGLDFGQLLVGQHHFSGGRRALAVRSGAEDLAFHLSKRVGIGLGSRGRGGRGILGHARAPRDAYYRDRDRSRHKNMKLASTESLVHADNLRRRGQCRHRKAKHFITGEFLCP
jgi:hypothetical protein